MALRTPLAQVRGLGATGSGTTHFLHQRLTALSNLILVPAALILLATFAGDSHAEMVTRLRSPIVAIVLAGAILSVTIHMRIGMQVIIEDYVHIELTKLALLALNTLYCAAVGLVCLYALARISFGV